MNIRALLVFCLMAFAIPASGAELGLVVLDGSPLLEAPTLSALPVMTEMHHKKPRSGEPEPPNTLAPATEQIGRYVLILQESPDTKWRLIEGHQYCARLTMCRGWLPRNAVASRSEFRIVKHWTGPKKIELEAGDHADTYQFLPNGRFITETDRGRLYQSGDVVWAIVDGKGDSGDAFVFRGGRLCWAEDDRICVNAN
jgi:hypothetical protein